MEESKNKGKQILLIIISLIFLVITYFVFNKYVFNKDVPSLSINLVNSENIEAEVAKIKGKMEKINSINIELFNSGKFRSLRESYVKKLVLDEYKKGKSNPFEQKKVETKIILTEDDKIAKEPASDDN